MEALLITGANGQLGSEIRAIADRYPEIQFYFTDVMDLDITKPGDVTAFVQQNRITGIINCAAYTAVDRAEEDIELARKVNVDGPAVLGQVAREFKLKLIHVSTDYVFDGENFTPYKEEEPVNPIGAYGQTKLDGEKAVMANHPDAVIIRTSWLYSSFGNNFVKTMRRLMNERDSIGVIFDQVGTPTYAADLAEAVLDIFNDPDFSIKSGIYHYSNEGAISWYDFAMAIREICSLSCQVKPLQTFEFPTKTKRPHYSVLNKSKIKQAFSLEIPYWKHSLEICLDRLKQQEVKELVNEKQNIQS